MANIAFPNVSLESIDFALDYPGQTVHASIYTGARQVIDRGIGVWEGSFTWPALGRADAPDDIAAIETFLNQLSGAANTFDIPLPVNQADRFNLSPAANPETYLTISSNAPAGAQALVQLNRADGLRIGDYITIDNKLFQFTSPLARQRANIVPYRRLPTTHEVTTTIHPTLPVIWAQPYLRARRTSSEPVSNNKDIDWAGPWTVEFTQATEA